MDIIFETEKLIAVPAKEEDIAYIMDLENHPKVRRFVWQGTYEEHLEEIKEEDMLLAMFLDKNSKDVVGYTLCENYRKFDVFELRRIAFDARGKGYGRDACLGIFDYAFEKLGANRLWLDVYPDNEIGINLYESLGMHRDGELRQSYKSDEGEYRNQIIYSILRSEWEEGKHLGKSQQ